MSVPCNTIHNDHTNYSENLPTTKFVIIKSFILIWTVIYPALNSKIIWNVAIYETLLICDVAYNLTAINKIHLAKVQNFS